MNVEHHQKLLMEAAHAFHKQFGHLHPPTRYVADGLNLGAFLNRCRKSRASGTLRSAIAEKLDRIDPRWSHPSVVHRSEPMLHAARQFKNHHGHLQVPKAYVAQDGTGLGWWLSDRRNQHRAGTLSHELAQQLNSIDAEWAKVQNPAETRRASRTAQALAAIEEFRIQHGDGAVPSRYETPNGFKLGAWISARRTEKRQGKLDPSLAWQLDGLGFSLNPVKAPSAKKHKPATDRRVRRDDEYIELIYEYLDIHEDSNVPSRYVTSSGIRLGAWLARQKAAARKGTLDPAVENQLLELKIRLPRRGSGHFG